MGTSDYRQYQAEQDLLKCGLSRDSISAIRSTSVVEHEGTQQVVHNSDVHKYQPSQVPSDLSPNDDNLAQQLEDHQRMFTRYKRFSEERITAVEKQLSQTLSLLKEVSQTVDAMKSNQKAQASRAHTAVVSPTPSEQAPQQQVAQQQEPQVAPTGAVEIKSNPANKPIDRNNVAPESVSIEKIFYCGTK